MYREIITSDSQEITLKLPVDYLNKRLEILVFEVNEGFESAKVGNTPSHAQVVDLKSQMSLAKAIMAENVEVLSKLAQ